MAKGGNTFTTIGGKRRKSSRSRRTKKARRTRRGGFAGAIEQAVVPFGLLAVQKRMQKRSRKSGSKSRKSRRR